MVGLEIIPIGTILAVLTNQVLKTAHAAADVLVGKESFKILSKHLFDIEPVLKELQLQELNESQAARAALESLESDVKRANNLVEKYRNRGRFYLLVKCRYIVGEVEQVTRDIGKSLAALSLANTEVLTRISDQVDRLQNEMQRVEFEASRSQLQIVEKLDYALREQKLDQAFANDMLEEIARAVGVPVEPSEISKELASIRKEKEEAASRKERAEYIFLEQIIELLSRADAARDYEGVKKQYFERVQVIERYDSRERYILPLNPFLCSITGVVMVDPVSLCTGTTCERSAIEDWFHNGNRTDPETNEVLEETTLRSNIPLRQSIEEWRELNYCLVIRSIKENLITNYDVHESLSLIQALMRENSINKDWISIGGVTDVVISILGNSNYKEAKLKILITLKDVVEGHARNKEKVAESQGWDQIICCLGGDSSTSKAAIDLLYELLQGRSGWNKSFCKKLSQNQNAIPFLVTFLKGSDNDSAEAAEKILMEVFKINEESITTAARFGWYKPLVDRMIQEPDSRLGMVKGIVSLELNLLELKELGEEGVIPPLLEMLCGSIESKDLSLSALVKLAGCPPNKRIIAESGGVPLILDLTFSTRMRTFITIKCCEILEKLSFDEDGIDLFVDREGNQLELDSIITNLLALQQSFNTGYNFRKPALRALLGICKFETDLIKKAILAANSVSLILPLLDDSDSEIRETAINLLFLFSQHEPDGVVEYLFRPRRLEALIGFLENDENDNVRMAAAGLLANLPKSERELTMKLIELGGLDAIISILRTGTMEAKENALSALFRFTDPTNIESQRDLVKRGIYPLLVNFLNTGSVTAKARAAAFIADLSMSTPKLTIVSKSPSCWFFKSSRVPLCLAHGSICSVATTFCLIEANALPGLIKLLHGEVHATAYEAIQTLSTLVLEDFPQRGAIVLHKNNAITPLLEILNWGSDSLKAEALGLLEKVFVSKEMVEYYGTTARLRLIGITGMNIYGDGHLRRKAAKVLSLLERYSRSSSSAISGVPE
ncbi:U-box domain-containing protein 43 [Arachis duranensis]|uniref:RING-type E3 ubiquitin transferase n=1 Tax=Arachis duranensis TaxID=130453 RepID=A0A6P5MSD9_ARADU|nr:U-box domain-containing protein 43 [Arachis duranensis]XP_015940597.1 U-box domain-containing protein 43 [Arachis duranensis]XP_015940599.1 U-box domain-containing protein 43 [Arachis duranensis]XP_020986091.1 U-box domain-containing protein 43 [Arachis duranensis]XP_020986093.1 U-box domain-containing protein 43 [Arachis duranensis]XP_020986095.1 U-box domain-containing protein 43 [Arachis duranensis]XP_020986098.1 U-box domain-containing protein 43 [Arachis duranensis]XP_020986101.1 U-b